ncbi:LOW QUALITY PROTEIN: integrase core domain protein [Vespula maculifrons]|uniref:Integrase core domain protein n=1 Tax=Vespula maculifrons TaxID=7453 RepID=A0ABD2CSN3_VESMC
MSYWKEDPEKTNTMGIQFILDSNAFGWDRNSIVGRKNSIKETIPLIDELFAAVDYIKVKTIVKIFMEQVVPRHAIVRITYRSRIRKTKTTALHPLSEDEVQRQHRTIIDYLTKFLDQIQRDYNRRLHYGLLVDKFEKHETNELSSA